MDLLLVYRQGVLQFYTENLNKKYQVMKNSFSKCLKGIKYFQMTIHLEIFSVKFLAKQYVLMNVVNMRYSNSSIQRICSFGV